MMDHSTFMPSREWQDVPPGAVLPEGCQIRLDMSTGNQQARWAPSNDHAELARGKELKMDCQEPPPLDDLEREYQEQQEATVTGDALFDLSHDGLALDMGRRWQRDARHIAAWGKWLFWTGALWLADEHLDHMTRCRDYLRQRADALVHDTKTGKLDWGDEVDAKKAVKMAEATAKQLRSAPMVANVSSLARSNPELVGTVEQWNSNVFAISEPNRRSAT